MTEHPILTDKVGVIGLDAVEYPEHEHITTVSVGYIKQATELLDVLGWDQVDVCSVPSKNADYPMLVLRPPHESLFAGEQAGISITPRTKQGREKGSETDQ